MLRCIVTHTACKSDCLMLGERASTACDVIRAFLRSFDASYVMGDPGGENPCMTPNSSL